MASRGARVSRFESAARRFDDGLTRGRSISRKIGAFGWFLGLLLFLTTAAEVRAAPEAQPEADLVFLNRQIIRFRNDLYGMPPASRAKQARHALEEALASGVETVDVRRNEAGDVVLVGGRLVFLVTPGDVDRLTNQTQADLTKQVTQRLRQVMKESKEARNTKALLEGGLRALIETGVMILLLGLAAAARRWTMPRLTRLLTVHAAPGGRAGEFAAIWLDRAASAVTLVVRTVFWAFSAMVLYVWLGSVLNEFPYTRAWGERLNGYFFDLVLGLLHGITEQVPNLLTAAAMFGVAYGFSRLIRPFLDRVEAGAGLFSWLDKDTVRPTRQIVNVLIWIFALVMAYPYLPGAETEAFKGVSVLIGLMVSLGASSVVGQAASGLILMYSRTVKTGEYVRIGDHEGTIVAVGMFLTRVRTGRGAEVVIPNSTILGTATVNYSRTLGASFVLDTSVTIGYDTPWRQVHAMLLEAARRTRGIVASPEPRVFQTRLADFYPEYCLVCAAKESDPRARAEVLSELHGQIQDVFNEYGVQIMSPNYLGDPAHPKVVPPDLFYAEPAQRPGPSSGPSSSTGASGPSSGPTEPPRNAPAS